MNKWKHSIDIKQHLGEATDSAAVRKAAAGVIQELHKLPGKWFDSNHYDFDYNLAEFIEEFTDLAEDEDADCDEFNYVLSDLYDWADSEPVRVFMGL